MVLRSGGKERYGKTQMLPFAIQLEQLQQVSIATCSSSASLYTTQPHAPHTAKTISLHSDNHSERHLCRDINLKRLFIPFPHHHVFFLLSKLFTRNYFRQYITTSSKITFSRRLVSGTTYQLPPINNYLFI